MSYSNQSQSPIFVWLDENAYNDEGKATRKTLEEILGNIMVFVDESECRRFLGRDINKKRILLIISGRLGKEFIPTVHSSEGILSIYIYCSNKSLYEEWAKDYSKVI